MIRHVAVVVDDHPASEFALGQAAAQAREHHARLTVLHVRSRVPLFAALAGQDPRVAEAEADARAERVLRELVAAVPADVPCTMLVRRGRRVATIVGVLAGFGCDTLVITREGIATQVARRAPATRVVSVSATRPAAPLAAAPARAPAPAGP